MSIIKVIFEEQNPILSLDEIKNFLRIDFDSDDILLQKALNTATRQCELKIGQTLNQKTYLMSIYNPLKTNKIKLKYEPIISVEKIEHIDENENTSLISTDNYKTMSDIGIIKFFNIPLNYYKLDITYKAGYMNVPDDLKQGLLFHIAKIYEDKTGFYPIRKASNSIYKNYQKIKF
jgi:uncharacterized phiE125 gp8 family phage protein